MWIGVAALLTAGFIGGQSPLFLKIALHEFPPLIITLLRFVIASIILSPFFIKEYKTLKKPDLKKLIGSSVFFSGNLIIFGIAVQYTSAIASQILYTLSSCSWYFKPLHTF